MNTPIKVCSFVAMMLVAVLIVSEVSEAAGCDASQLKPCLGAIQGGTAPSEDCCAQMKSQQSCLCGFLKDPSMKQYVNSPNARKVVSQCGVSVPSC